MRDEELTTISSREVGARMRELREKRGLSAADLAGKIGVAEDQLRAWENGQGVAPYETIKAIAAALATTTDSFVT
jgi:transcriptional regulator with XRE-family HTH domain